LINGYRGLDFQGAPEGPESGLKVDNRQDMTIGHDDSASQYINIYLLSRNILG
jgi:hypothetical protein